MSQMHGIRTTRPPFYLEANVLPPPKQWWQELSDSYAVGCKFDVQKSFVNQAQVGGNVCHRGKCLLRLRESGPTLEVVEKSEAKFTFPQKLLN
jgi:hypothetical protein